MDNYSIFGSVSELYNLGLDSYNWYVFAHAENDGWSPSNPARDITRYLEYCDYADAGCPQDWSFFSCFLPSGVI